MTHLLVLIGTGVGWAMIGHVAVNTALRRLSRHRTPKRDTEQARLERIARLEIACGVGLKYGRDAVMAAKVRVEPHMQDLFDAGNGAVRRDCWNCHVSFHEYAHQREDRDGELSVRLCPKCLTKARAELDYGVPL